MRTIGTFRPRTRASLARSMVSPRVVGLALDITAACAFWMVGPSAVGLLKGTPSSMISVPPRSMASKTSTVSSGDG
eukprot:scaffold3438_cov62-Phaeocystis_antarctica.AAC.3